MNSKLGLAIIGGALGLALTGIPVSASNTALSLSDYGTSSRTLALGGVEGLHAEAYSVFENPASLPRDHNHHYSSFFMALADSESTFFNAAASFPLFAGHVGVGFAQKQSPNLDFTSVNSNDEFQVDSKFAVSETQVNLGYQQSINSMISMGASLHYFVQDLFVTKGTGWNANAGIQLDASPFLVSFGMKNIFQNSEVGYTNGYSSLVFPSALVLAGRYTYSDNLAFYGQLSGSKLLKSGGIRYTPIPLISILAGSRAVDINGIHRQFSAGLSLNLAMMQVNFSYQASEVAEHDSLYGISMDLNIDSFSHKPMPTVLETKPVVAPPVAPVAVPNPDVTPAPSIEPVKPAGEPVKPVAIEPAKPVTVEPAKPVTVEAAQPVTVEPAQPVTVEPVQPVKSSAPISNTSVSD